MAVLLDNFITASAQMEQREKELETARFLRDNQSRSPLEPLLVKVRRMPPHGSSSPLQIPAAMPGIPWRRSLRGLTQPKPPSHDLIRQSSSRLLVHLADARV